MWNIKNIKERKKYVEQRLKNCNDKKEKEKLQLSLLTYFYLLSNSGSIRYTKFYNFLDKISGNKFSLVKESKYAKMENKIVFGEMPIMDSNYIKFLLQLLINITNQSSLEELSENELAKINIQSENLKSISKNFYRQFGDEDIYKNAMKLLDDEESLNFTPIIRNGYSDFGGITVDDYIFNKAFCNVTQQNTYFDLQATNHEIMHGIDFYFKPKLESEIYHGFHEIPTYTIDYFFINYLEEIGLDKEQTQKLRMQKDYYLYFLAKSAMLDIRLKTTSLMKKINSGLDVSEEVMKIITPPILTKMLEVESGIIAFGLYKQIIENRENGIENLKLILKNGVPRNQIPNFSYIGLSNEQLLNLSNELGSYSKMNEFGLNK